MNAVEKIEAVVTSGILLPELTIIPQRGATANEMRVEESLLGRRLSTEHVSILSRWNGIALEVVRLFGCGDQTGEIGRLSDFQVDLGTTLKEPATFGSDAAGFLYIQDSACKIWSLDTDGGELREIAKNLDDFIVRLVFGPDALLFAGEDWLRELRGARLIP